MNWLLKAAAVVVFGCLAGLMGGCISSSSLVDKWHDTSFKAPPLSKMLVIAVRKDATKRRIWEDAFASELAKHNVGAIASYQLFSEAPPDSNQVIATVQTNGFDGILVIRNLLTETNKQYVKGYTSTEYYSPYWQSYATYFREIQHPGYTDSQTVDTRVIDVSTTGSGGRLIWSAKSRTPDPGSVTDVQRGISGLVISELEQRKIISPKK